MSTKKGYIVQYQDKWYIAERAALIDGGFCGKYWSYKGHINIHPDSLPTILSNGSLKPEYQGEVEYETKKLHGDSPSKVLNTTYAIPKPVESKGDVWYEAVESLCYKHFDCEYETAHRFICDLRKIEH